jgi:pyruvate dehydrogenase E2 component (dihydrolipoamide acetyltransferase)
MAQEVKLSMDGLLLNWLKQVGDAVKAGEIIAEFEADKATVEVVAPADGVIIQLVAAVGDEVREGSTIARIGAGAESAAPVAASQPVAAVVVPAAVAPAASNGAVVMENGRVKASPLARKVAQDKGVDLTQVAGSGPGGRIVRADVEGFTPAAAPQPAAAQPSAAQSAPEAAVSLAQTYGKLPEGDDVEVMDASRMRKAIAKGTITSFMMTPHFYVTMESDVAELLRLRKQLNDQLADSGVKITVNDMVVKAVALALKRFPNLNTHYYGDKLVRHKRINVAIAVALPNNGLVNVVSPNADKTTLSEMARYHAQMFADARDGKIKPEYVQGATFLVSNLGSYGVESFSAIIDSPQSGALAVGAAQLVPIVLQDGTIGVGNRMKATLSIDHRISDGAEGAQFMQYFKALIENPMRLLV